MSFFDNLKKKVEQLGSEAAEWTTKAAKDTAEWTTQAAKDTAQAAKDTAEWTTQAAKDTVEWTTQAAKDTAEWTTKAAKDTTEWTTKAAKDTAEWTTQAAKDTTEWTTQAAKDTAEWTSGKWEEMGKYAEDFQKWKNELPDKLHEFKDNFSIEDFWKKINDTALNAGQEVVFMALTIYYSIANQFKSDDLQSPNKQQKK